MKRETDLVAKHRYICEISPAKHRGTLTTGPQLFVTCGLMTGFFTCYGSADIQSSFSWRLPFILLASYSAAFAVASLLLLPASPRWLAEHGRDRLEVTAAWEKLGVSSTDREDMIDAENPGHTTPKYRVSHGTTLVMLGLSHTTKVC